LLPTDWRRAKHTTRHWKIRYEKKMGSSRCSLRCHIIAAVAASNAVGIITRMVGKELMGVPARITKAPALHNLFCQDSCRKLLTEVQIGTTSGRVAVTG